ncbi:MAG: class I SAM-dependent methyltransferase [Candidatus Pacebacteria bacterium]|nr:class I SAM-dependent methyltransferase [Candidatus Paceibacterota bacterium]
MKFGDGSREMFESAKDRHPDPRSMKDKVAHEVSEIEPVQNWLKDRAELMIKRSGVEDVVEEFSDEEKIRIVDVGGGKGHMMQELIKSNPDKEIKTVGIDLSDYASKKVSKSNEGEKMDSVFGDGENMPIKDKSVEMATAYFTFQELDDDQQNEILEQMREMIKDNGRIVLVDEILQEEKTEGIIAHSKNILLNLKVSKFNLRSEDEWKKFFEDNELEVESSVIFGDDEENKKEQFISFVLKKTEEKDEK